MCIRDRSGVNVSAYDKLSATFADLSKSFLNIINVPIGGFIKLLAENTGLLLAVMLKFASSISGQVLGSLGEMAEESGKNAEAQLRFRGAMGSTLQTLARSNNGYVRLGKALANNTAKQEDFNAALKTNRLSLLNTMTRRATDGKRLFTIKLIENKNASFTDQNELDASYARKIDKSVVDEIMATQTKSTAHIKKKKESN